MGRARIRLHSLCIGHATPRVRVSSAFSSRSKSSSSASIKYGNRTELFSSNGAHDYGNDKADKGAETGNKIMVVVDSSLEAKGALEWALSHTVQSQDTVVLVHIVRPTRGAESSEKFNLKAYQLLLDKKNMCEMKRPGVQVKVVMLEVEGEEKGPAIVEEAKQQRVSLLVIGQRKRSILWCLMKWARIRTRARVVEYCIQNAPCMTIAVRRKNEKLGGYLITTKRHKRFWLLA